MELNEKNQAKDSSIDSKISNNYKLKSDTLDELYKEQLPELRDLIFRRAQSNDIDICRKWLKVFSRISREEKMARNCLCTLMQEQIIENGCLQEPFTNLQNCNRNLENVLSELDDQINDHLSNQSFRSDSNHTFKSHGLTADINFEQPPDTKSIFQETSELTRNMQFLRMQLTEKQIENVKLREIAEKSRLEMKTFEKMLQNIKNTVLVNIRELILDMGQRGILRTDYKFLQNIFTPFSKDKEFMSSVGKYDLDLQYVLHKQFKCEFDKRKSLIAHHICRKFVKSKAKLREKFERRLTMQSESHKLQLKLAKLNSFSLLREVFINNHEDFGKFEGWEILKALEDKYRKIVNDDIN